MNIYTHYKKYRTSNGAIAKYRWRTILQFGSSWGIIGSVVMKNPGSSDIINDNDNYITDQNILFHLDTFDYPCDRGENWFVFRPDATMECIAALFAQKTRVPTKNDLHGVIQIFNLFYLCEQKLPAALKANRELQIFKPFEDRIFEYDIQSLKAPIYLGFSKLGKSLCFREKALRFCTETIEKHHAKYLDPTFDNNCFCHPLALMRYGKTRYSYLRESFCAD